MMIPLFALELHFEAPTWFVLGGIGAMVILILVGLRRSPRKT